jgi:hypothetical protein
MGIRELKGPFQTELAIDTNTRVTDTQIKVANTETMVADMYQNMFTGQKGGSGQCHSVSATCYS